MTVFSKDEWTPFQARLDAGPTQKAPCLECGVLSSGRPRGWWFRFVPVRGQGRHGPKVRTERVCPKCLEEIDHV